MRQDAALRRITCDASGHWSDARIARTPSVTAREDPAESLELRRRRNRERWRAMMACCTAAAQRKVILGICLGANILCLPSMLPNLHASFST